MDPTLGKTQGSEIPKARSHAAPELPGAADSLAMSVAVAATAVLVGAAKTGVAVAAAVVAEEK